MHRPNIGLQRTSACGLAAEAGSFGSPRRLSVAARLSTIVLIAMSFAATNAIYGQAHDRVWVWNPRCQKATTVALRVRLDGKTLYRTSLPVCRWERQFEEGKTSFRFTPARPLVWYGYRSDEGDGSKDPGDPTPAGAPLEVEFWQAGGETDSISLGYTVSARDGLHMNSLHILSPLKKSVSTMAPGLVLDSWPERTKR